MNEKLKNLIAQCVEKNVSFSGAVGSVYNVQELIHNTGMKSINNMWKRVKKAKDALETDSLYENSNSTKEKRLELEMETLSEIFKYKKEIADKAKELEARRKESAEKLAILKKMKTEKEFEELGKKSLEEINKEIEKYSS